MGKLSRMKAAITVGLAIFDMISDLLLAVDYYKTGQDQWWFGLTLTFFLLPVVVLALIGLVMLYEKNLQPEALKAWKTFECMAESGPQLILQLYIMALPDANIVTGTKETNSTVTQNMNFQLYSDTYETTSNFSINVTKRPDISSSNNSDISLTLILQVLTIIR